MRLDVKKDQSKANNREHYMISIQSWICWCTITRKLNTSQYWLKCFDLWKSPIWKEAD